MKVKSTNAQLTKRAQSPCPSEKRKVAQKPVGLDKMIRRARSPLPE